NDRAVEIAGFLPARGAGAGVHEHQLEPVILRAENRGQQTAILGEGKLVNGLTGESDGFQPCAIADVIELDLRRGVAPYTDLPAIAGNGESLDASMTRLDRLEDLVITHIGDGDVAVIIGQRELRRVAGQGGDGNGRLETRQLEIAERSVPLGGEVLPVL